MRPLHHVVSSVIFSTGVYLTTKSISLTALNFVAGVLIDIDHIPEFIYKYGLKNPFIFLKTEMHLTAKKTILPLHGFDIISLIFGLIWFAGYQNIAWAVYIGFLQHLILDSIYNPSRSVKSYFLIYRIIVGFDTDKILHRVNTEDYRKNGSLSQQDQ